jgi:hypothetical protein
VFPYIRSARKAMWKRRMRYHHQRHCFSYPAFIAMLIQVTSIHQLIHVKTISYQGTEEIVQCYIGYPRQPSFSTADLPDDMNSS